MSELSAFIVKTNQPATREIEQNIERDMYIAFKVFTEKEQAGFVMDEENNTMIAFISAEDKHKLDGIVEAISKHQNGIVTMYEDVTDKFVHKNDFSCYNQKSVLIDNFVKSKLTLDGVLEKITSLGMNNLTEIDMQILQGA